MLDRRERAPVLAYTWKICWEHWLCEHMRHDVRNTDLDMK